MKDEKLYPNTTQYPNLYIDQVMHLLSGSEWKILSYIVRRTFGFRKESDGISFRQVCEGNLKLDKQGFRVEHGTGFSKNTVVKALKILCEKTRLIDRFPRKGKEHIYQLNLNPETIDFDWLLKRKRKHEKQSAKDIENARALNPKITHPVQQDGLEPILLDRITTHPAEQDTQKPSRNIVLRGTKNSIQEKIDSPAQYDEYFPPRLTEKNASSESEETAFSSRELDLRRNPYLTLDRQKEIENNPQLKNLARTIQKSAIRQERGEKSFTVIPEAGGSDQLGDRLWRKFSKLTGLTGEWKKPKKEIQQKTKHLRELAKPYLAIGLSEEESEAALEVSFLEDFVRQKTKTPFWNTFEEEFKYCMSRALEGTLEDYRRELIEQKQFQLRSSSGQQAQGRGPSEDARRRGRAVEAIVERRRREAEQEMLLLRGDPDPSA